MSDRRSLTWQTLLVTLGAINNVGECLRQETNVPCTGCSAHLAPALMPPLARSAREPTRLVGPAGRKAHGCWPSLAHTHYRIERSCISFPTCNVVISSHVAVRLPDRTGFCFELAQLSLPRFLQKHPPVRECALVETPDLNYCRNQRLHTWYCAAFAASPASLTRRWWHRLVLSLRYLLTATTGREPAQTR